jgi:hypothetical protein
MKVSFRIRRDPLLTYGANPLVSITAAPPAPKIPCQRPELLGSTWDIENGREKTTSTADLFLATAAAALLLEGTGFCELPGAAGVRMIWTERVLELFRSRAGGGTSFIALALNLQSASHRQIGTA